jgi:hypothetical protein
MHTSRSIIESNIFTLLSFRGSEDGSLLALAHVTFAISNYPELENWTFVVRNCEIVGIVRSVLVADALVHFTYFYGFDDNRLLFFRDLGVGVRERIELRQNGTGDIRKNSTLWDFTDWELTHLFRIDVPNQ